MMTIQRNQPVKVITGPYKDETGVVIRRPMGRDRIVTVSRENGRTFDVKAVELEVVATNGYNATGMA